MIKKETKEANIKGSRKESTKSSGNKKLDKAFKTLLKATPKK